MQKFITKSVWLLLAAFSPLIALAEAQVAFPTAEGYGKYTVGGRGGAVYAVTNLDDSGPGSLRAAVEAKGPRTVVFRVSGTINLKSDLDIKHPYITITGQTAPGDGITLRGHPLMIYADEVIIRYIRVRLGDEAGDFPDAITGRFTNNLILDHVSASWSIDETMTIYHGTNLTVQWCIISESLYESNHKKGNHGYGGIWGYNYSTFHHNLIASHSNRNPRFASGCGNVDYRNNVVYNWGYASTYGGEMAQLSNPEKYNFSTINMVANYYKPGPATQPGEVTHQLASPWSRNGQSDYGKWYIADNFMVGSPEVTQDNWQGVVPSLTAIKGVQAFNPRDLAAIPGLKLDKPWPAMAIHQQSPQEAYAAVLANAGAILPKRDAVDVRILDEVSKGYATYKGATYEKHHEVADKSKMHGIIDSQKDVGGWPELQSTPAPVDTDQDGMPDDWEKASGLNPADPADRNLVATDGYTMLEKYLNNIR